MSWDGNTLHNKFWMYKATATIITQGNALSFEEEVGVGYASRKLTETI